MPQQPNPEPAASSIPLAPPIDSLLNGTWNARKASAEVGRATASTRSTRLAMVDNDKHVDNSGSQPPHTTAVRDSLLAELKVRLSDYSLSFACRQLLKPIEGRIQIFVNHILCPSVFISLSSDPNCV